MFATHAVVSGVAVASAGLAGMGGVVRLVPPGYPPTPSGRGVDVELPGLGLGTATVDGQTVGRSHSKDQLRMALVVRCREFQSPNAGPISY
jgi:hypothetical protein